MTEDGLSDLTDLSSESQFDHERIISNGNCNERKHCPHF